jgi:N-methylhydantoinase B
MSDAESDIDPVTLSVIRGQLTQLTNEMDLTLVNSAFSPIICEANDMASGVFRPDGRTISQGDFGLPIFVGNMEFTVTSIAEEFEGNIEPGDVFITNDPYVGGTHLLDVTLVEPYFHEGELLAFVANTGHWTDIAGASPGGFTGKTTEIQQEGIRIKPTKLFEGGELNEDLLELVLANVRRSDDIRGDYKAQLNALNVGDERFESLLAEYGAETVKRAIEELERRSEHEMRSHIEEIPDGTYSFVDSLDNDGIVDTPLNIDLDLTIDGSDVSLDFTGSSGPARGPVNAPKSCTVSACNIAFKHIYADIPINAGCFQPLEFTIPDETFLNAKAPRPTMGYTEVSQRVLDTAFGALSKAIPEDVPGQAFSTSCGMSMGGRSEEGEFVFPYAIAGGYGGNRTQDGLTHCTPPYARARMPSVEVIEDQYPLRFHEKRLRPDSAGAGRRRGGLGTVYDIEFRGEEATFSCVGDRTDHTPSGVAGGKSAKGTLLEFTIDGETYVPPMRNKEQDLALSTGDRLHIESPGGGGYGDPTERESDRVLEDIVQGYVTPEAAEQEYGVVVETVDGEYQVNEAATSELRSRLDD